MHPRIQELYDSLKSTYKKKSMDVEVLRFLKEIGASRTEASITLHQGFLLDLDEVDDFVISSNIWDNVDINDVFYETLKYLYYNKDDPNYEDDGSTVKISL